MKYTFEKAISGTHGTAIQALALSAINFELSRQISNHPSLKMPVDKPASPDDLRALLVIPELDGRTADAVSLDLLIDANIATCALTKDVASTTDFDTNGRQVRPFAYLIDRIRTPISSIEATYDWRADMAAKVAVEQASLLGIKDTTLIETKAKERAIGDMKERKAYAIAEVNSLIRPSIMNEETSKLIEMIVDLDGKAFNGLLLTHNAAVASVASATRRLEAGKFVTVDSEVVLFAKSAMRDDKVD